MVAASNRKDILWGCYGVSLIIYVVIFLWGMLGDHNGSYFGWGIVSFYCFIPVFSFIMALELNAANASFKWLYSFVFSALGLTIGATVSLAKLSTLVIFSDVWIFCVAPAFIGSIIGLLIRKKHSKTIDLS